MLQTFAVPEGRTPKRGLRSDQAVDDIADRAVAADGKDRVLFLRRSLLRQLDGVCAALSFCCVHLPASRFQFLDGRFDERLYVITSRRGVVDDDCTSHERDYNRPTPIAK